MNIERMPELPGVEHHFIDVRGLRMHVAVAGSGEPLVLLHGWPQHWWEWRRVIGPLAEHYRVICPDLRGLGWTGAPPEGYRPEVMADDIAGLLDRMGVHRFRLVGHDWGGLVGYQLALRSPDRVSHYIAVNTASPFLRPTPRVLLNGVRVWHIPLNAAPLIGRRMSGSVVPRWALRHWTYRSAALTSEDARIFLAQFRDPARVRATVSYYRNIVRRELPLLLVGKYRWSRLTVPVLVLSGDRDPLLSAGQMTGFDRWATDLRVESMVDVGHFPPIEDPDSFVAGVLGFCGDPADRDCVTPDTVLG